MAKASYVDVNKDKYMKALFLDLQKSTKMISLDEKGDIIHNFIMNNPSNDKSEVKINNNGLPLSKDGHILVYRSV